MNRPDVLAADRAHLWHPYTAMGRWPSKRDVLVVREAEGAWLVDADGRRLLDANSSWWTMTLGHRHPRLMRAAQRQLESLDHVAFAGITHEPAAALGRELLEVAPAGLERVFYVDNGSTAIEFALKCCVEFFQRTGEIERREFVTFAGAFHGDTSGATSLGGVETFVAAYASITFPCHRVPAPWDESRALEGLERVLRERGDRVAGVFLEPMLQGAAGMKMQSASFLRRVAELTRAHGALFVADEVFAGYGRTGRFWACDHAEIAPDLLCTGKAFAQFIPMGAVLVSGRVYEPFAREDAEALPYGHTFNGNPFGAALAREVLAVYRDERIVARVSEDAALFRASAERLAAMPGVVRVRSLGFVVAADLEDPSGAEGYGGTIGWRVYEEALARGVYLRPLGSTVYACPPLVTSNEDLAVLFDALESGVRAAFAGR
jgi:adenosylmethionine-8-amino-7-oxononanoate aminotransferase